MYADFRFIVTLFFPYLNNSKFHFTLNQYIKDIIETIDEAEAINDYPDYSKGPCILVLQKDRTGKPVHVVWGIPKKSKSPAVLITAYRPDPERWNDDFTRRNK